MKWSSEVRVGCAVSAALLILMVALLLVADVRWPGSGYKITATFGFLGDLRENAPIKYAGGIEVGKVTGIRALGDRAAVDLLITRKDFRLRRDSYVVIYTAGMLGEKYLNIGADLGKGEELKPGEVIQGVDPSNLDEAFITMTRLMETLNGVLGTNEAKQSIQRSFKNVANTTEELAVMTRDTRAKVMRILDDLSKSGQNVQSVTRSLESLSRSVEELTRTLDKKNLNEAVRNLNSVLKNLDELAKNTNAGKGAAGVLLKDEKVAKDIQELVEDLRRHPWKLLWKK